MQDIKACFPSDRNPFYAGFGNRDTDEFSYLKVGIPRGKIFIINPKVLLIYIYIYKYNTDNILDKDLRCNFTIKFYTYNLSSIS